MKTVTEPSAFVRWTLQLEDATALDRPVRAFEPRSRRCSGAGHAGRCCVASGSATPSTPSSPTSCSARWTSATVLDLFGGADSSPSARTLIGTGLLAVGPTAWTGWAEWSAAGPRDKRVGLVHAVTNGAAIGFYAGSWLARRRGRHGSGVRLALAGLAATGVGAYLGGHLTAARKVGSHDPAFDGARRSS